MGDVIKYRKSIGGYILDSLFGVDKQNIVIQDSNEEDNFCGHCGKKILKTDKEFICQYGWCGDNFCSDCAKKCKKCGKHYCIKHIKSHTC